VVISGLPLRSPGTKNHLVVAPMERRRVYYKGFRAFSMLGHRPCTQMSFCPGTLKLGVPKFLK
jgi:hypothetical protein